MLRPDGTPDPPPHPAACLGGAILPEVGVVAGEEEGDIAVPGATSTDPGTRDCAALKWALVQLEEDEDEVFLAAAIAAFAADAKAELLAGDIVCVWPKSSDALVSCRQILLGRRGGFLHIHSC